MTSTKLSIFFPFFSSPFLLSPPLSPPSPLHLPSLNLPLSSFPPLSSTCTHQSSDEEEFEVELHKSRGLGIIIAGLMDTDTGGEGEWEVREDRRP